MKWVVVKHDGIYQVDCIIFFRRIETSTFHKLVFKFISKCQYKKSQRNSFLLFTVEYLKYSKALSYLGLLFLLSQGISTAPELALTIVTIVFPVKNQKSWLQSNLPYHLVKSLYILLLPTPLFFFTSFVLCSAWYLSLSKRGFPPIYLSTWLF